MSYFGKVREWWSAPKTHQDPMMLVRASEMIFVLNPNETAALELPHGSTVLLTGLAGIIWVTVQGSIYDYRLKNSETLELPGAGLMVFQSLTQNVPGKIQISITRKRVH